MKHLRRKMTLIIAALCMILLVACGKGNDTKEEVNEYTYAASFKDVEFGDGYLSGVLYTKNYLYAMNYNEMEGTSSWILTSVNMDNDERREVPVELAADEFINHFMLDNDGNMKVMINTYDMSSDQPSYNFANMDKEGKITDITDFSSLLVDIAEAYPDNMVMDKEGNTYFSVNGEGIFIVSPKFELMGKIEYKEWINSISAAGDGKVYAEMYGSTGLEFRSVDLKSKSFGDPIQFDFELYGNIMMVSGSDGKTLIKTSSSLYEVSLDTGEYEKVLDWIDCDINGDSIRSFGMDDNGQFWIISSTNNTDDSISEFVMIEKKLTKDVLPPKILTMGTLWASPTLKTLVVDFNKNSDAYRIEIKEYAGNDYEAGIIQFNADIIGGNCPDIIDSSGLNLKQMSAAGVFEDLNSYINNDPDINREDYFENVFKAFETNGNLFAVAPDFTILSLAGRKENVGVQKSWNQQEMIEVVNKHPDKQIKEYASAASVLYLMMITNLDSYVDWVSGECHFDGEEFKAILEFSKKVDSVDNMQTDMILYPGDPIDDDHSGEILLREEHIYSIESYQLAQAAYGNDANFIGYPVASGSGNMIGVWNGIYSISAKSKNKDEAWECLRSMLMPECQIQLVKSGNLVSFPVYKPAMDLFYKSAMEKDYEVDENGNKEEA